MFNKKKLNKGFTLIELLVVVAIIGLLSSVVLASLNTARSKGRDAKRLTEIRQLQTALELYYSENGAYPIRSWTHSDEAAWESGLGVSLQPYLATMPVDPLNNRSAPSASTGGAYQYVYSYYSRSYGGSGQWYMMPFRLENENNSLIGTDGAKTCNSSPNHVGRGAPAIGYFHYGIHSNAAYRNIITLGGNCTK